MILHFLRGFVRLDGFRLDDDGRVTALHVLRFVGDDARHIAAAQRKDAD